MKKNFYSGFYILLILVLFLFNGCGKKSDSLSDLNQDYLSKDFDVLEQKLNSKSPLSTISFGDDQNENLNSVLDRLIIRKGSMNIETDNYDQSEKKISDAAKSFKGYLTNTSSGMNEAGKKQGSVTARIPADNFDAFISEISKTGKVISQNISGNDVTEEYIDLEARQKTQRELERRLLELLDNKTAGLSDVVDVEQKLSNVRENIERTEAKMKYLKDKSAFSTLTVNLSEFPVTQTSSEGGFFYEIKNGFKKGIEGFSEKISSMIAFVIAFSPVIILLLLILYFIKKYFINKKINSLANKTS